MNPSAPICCKDSSMAKLMKSLMGGIASRVTGAEGYDVEVDKQSRVHESPVGSKLSMSGSDGEDNATVGNSSDGEDDPYELEVPTMKGCLNKWTNYLSGWQERYVVVTGGILSYYKTEFDTLYGCRGSISLHKAKTLVRPPVSCMGVTPPSGQVTSVHV